MYEFNMNKKNPFEHKFAHFQIFLIRTLTEWVSFWAQKLKLWARDTISKNIKYKYKDDKDLQVLSLNQSKC